jgi:hypothetical protein
LAEARLAARPAGATPRQHSQLTPPTHSAQGQAGEASGRLGPCVQQHHDPDRQQADPADGDHASLLRGSLAGEPVQPVGQVAVVAEGQRPAGSGHGQRRLGQRPGDQPPVGHGAGGGLVGDRLQLSCQGRGGARGGGHQPSERKAGDLREPQQPVVPQAQVGLFVGEHGGALVVVEQVQEALGDDHLAGAAAEGIGNRRAAGQYDPGGAAGNAERLGRGQGGRGDQPPGGPGHPHRGPGHARQVQRQQPEQGCGEHAGGDQRETRQDRDGQRRQTQQRQQVEGGDGPGRGAALEQAGGQPRTQQQQRERPAKHQRRCRAHRRSWPGSGLSCASARRRASS